MKKTNIKTKTILFFIYSMIIIAIIFSTIYSAIKPLTISTPPDIVQLATSQINLTYNQIISRTTNSYPGKLDLNQFSFGKVEPFK